MRTACILLCSHLSRVECLSSAANGCFCSIIVNIAYCIGYCLVRCVQYYSHIASIKSLVEQMIQKIS